MAVMPVEEKKLIQATPGVFEIKGDQAYLIGTKCSHCGAFFFPPRYVCTYCLTDEGVERVRLGNKGDLYAFTTIHVSSKEFKTPYLFGYVVLDPERIQVPAWITGVKNQEALKIGMKMEMVVEEWMGREDKTSFMTYKFRPIFNEHKNTESQQ